MNQELPPGQEADEIEDLTQIVADSLAKGEPPETIAMTLVDSGWEAEEALAYVDSIQHQMSQPRQTAGSSELQGWLIWGGGILLVNFLSWLFNWGFWIY